MSSKYFDDNKVNVGRQPELDLLKAICIVGMIMTHVFLDQGKDVVPSALDAYLTDFFGASTFMICMGIGMHYAHMQSPASYVARAFGLLTIGQFLNLLRNAIPNLIAYWFTGKQFCIANSFLILQSDILTFAGLSFFLMALFKKLKLKDSTILGISVLMSLTAFVLWKTVPSPKNYLAAQMLAFFIITKAEAYFPLLCYFIFVAFGYFIGGYYPRIKDKDALSLRIMAVCFPVAVVYFAISYTVGIPFLPQPGTDLHYSLKPTPDAIMTCIFTLGFLALLYRFVRVIGGKLPGVVNHFSFHINRYYCLSYLFILPVQTVMIATTGKVFSGTVLPILYGIFVIAACYFLIELNERYWHISFVKMRGKKLVIFTASVWIATVVIAAYAYPRIEEFANIWNNYLLP